MKKEIGKGFYPDVDVLTVHKELVKIREKYDPEFFSQREHQVFDEHHVLHELRHYLPSQTPLKDFIHHNSLHAFQQLKFYDAIFRASRIFGYQVTLQLSEYRELFKTGRIREDILHKLVIESKGEAHLD